MTSTTEKVPGVGGGAPRCYPQTPIARSRQLVARLRRRIQHDPHIPRFAVGLERGDPLTHTGLGGRVLRSGCADPAPARSRLGGPETARRGGYRPRARPPFGRLTGALLPHAIERDRFAAPTPADSESEVPPSAPKPCLPSPCESHAGGRRESGRALPPGPPSSPWDLIPPRLAPYWPHR